MRNKQKIYLISLLFLVMFILPVSVSATDPIYSMNCTVGPQSWHVFYLSSINPEGRHYYGSFTVSGEDVEFFVVDSSGYADIIGSGSTTDVIYNWGEIVGYFEWEFYTPISETYYFFFSNYDTLFNTATITGSYSYDNTAPTITINYPTTIYYNEGFTASFIVSDNFRVDSYQRYLDGVLQTSGTPQLQTFTISLSSTAGWDSSDILSGYHTIRIDAYDSGERMATKSFTFWVGYRPVVTTTTSTTIVVTSTTTTSHTTTIVPINSGFLIMMFAIIGVVIVVIVYAIKHRKSKLEDFANMEVVTP